MDGGDVNNLTVLNPAASPQMNSRKESESSGALTVRKDTGVCACMIALHYMH